MPQLIIPLERDFQTRHLRLNISEDFFKKFKELMDAGANAKGVEVVYEIQETFL